MTIKNGQSWDTCNFGHKHRTKKKARRKIKRWATWTHQETGVNPEAREEYAVLVFFKLVDANSTITKLRIIWWNDIIYISEYEVKGSGILLCVFLEKRFYKVCLRKHDLGEQIFILIRCYCESTFIDWHPYSWFLKSPLIHGYLNLWFRWIFIFVL